MFQEEDLIPISALQHFIFCPRQCALIHIEQLWNENLFTAQGRIMHEKVHSQTSESRRTIRVEYGMPLRSLRLGLIGKADVVEFHLEKGQWLPYPVEYKRGKTKPDNRDSIQLCAQALCLEEMRDVKIPQGALYYGKERHRVCVEFDEALRCQTAEAAGSVRVLIESGKTPLPVYESKCDSCSLLDLCLPKVVQRHIPVGDYLIRALQEHEKTS